MEEQIDMKNCNVKIPTISGKVELADSLKKEAQHSVANKGCFFGQRHAVALVCFTSNFLLCAIRAVLGVGIVAMVKHRQTNASSLIGETELSCPLPSVPPKPLVELNQQGEFDWSTELQGYLLGVGYMSYLVTQIPAGRLADAIGSKPLMVISNIVSGMTMIISPYAARWNIYAVISVHFLRGLSQGFTVPATFKMISNWIPKRERGTLSTLVVCGFAAGIAIGGAVTGWLCDIPHFGWPSAFYIWGAVNVVFAVAIHFLCYEFPKNHPRITDEELKYLTSDLETNVAVKHPPTPWKKIFSSIPCYAYFYGLFGHYWSITYFAAVHPTFMGTVLHYPMTENGVTSCLPVLLKSVGGVLASIICYWITKKNLVGINKLRKLTTGVGSIGFSLCMAGILLAECDAIINILCFALSLFSTGLALSGIMIAGVDMAPVFAGSLMGVASTIAGLSCVLIPVITGLVTTHETLSEWQIVFWINLVVVGTSGFVYVVFGSAEVQPWNYPEGDFPTEATTIGRRISDKDIKDSINHSKLIKC